MPFAHEVASVMHLPMQQIEQLRRRKSIQIEGTIRLGVIESMQASLLPGVIQHLLKKHPALQLKPARGRAVELIAAVKANELDAAIVVQPVKGGSQRLHWQHLFTNELVVIAPPNTKATKIQQLFGDYPWIRFDAGTSTGKLAAQWIAHNMPQAQRSMDLPSVHAVLSMVNAGLGVSMVPSIDPRMMIAYPVKVFPIGRGAPVLNVVLLTRKNDPNARTIDALFESLHAVALNMSVADR
jgi:DNA-binding transcriptional LysR family regulator